MVSWLHDIVAARAGGAMTTGACLLPEWYRDLMPWCSEAFISTGARTPARAV